MKKFFILGEKEILKKRERHIFEFNGHKLLLVATQGKFFLIENKCGHFGIALDTGTISKNTITCSQHGIKFELSTGEKINSPYEVCKPLKIFKLTYKGNKVGVYL